MNKTDFNIESVAARKNISSEKDYRHREKVSKDTLGDSEVRAVTVCFSNVEGKIHLIDYSKDFLLDSHDNLTFDGSSIRGFTLQDESDLRLSIDWETLYFLPASIDTNKAFVFASIIDKDGNPYESDIRAKLKRLRNELKNEGITVNAAAEIEGFLLRGIDAERNFKTEECLVPVTNGGYYDTMIGDELRRFIDMLSVTQRQLGFLNEKDHPEVGPSQFEINWGHTDVLIAADQIQLYKLTARHLARQMGYTASFLPKPIVGVNGSGMHTNISMSKDGKNMFYGENGLSDDGDSFALGVLNRANDLSLVLNSSVNSYRRLDPSYEAPNTISYSKCDRGSMIRIPLANEKSARIEIRAVSPDANPYLVLYSIMRAGLELQKQTGNVKSNNIEEIKIKASERNRLPEDMHSALDYFCRSNFMGNIMGYYCWNAYSLWKTKASNRCPKELGKHIKKGEILYHHEVYNQSIWSDF